MNGITRSELKVILGHLRDYDVVKLDRELPHLKQKCDVMSNRLREAVDNILGPFARLDEIILDKIASYAEPRWLENLDRAALELSLRSEYMREKIKTHQKENPLFCKNCGGRCAEWWQMEAHYNRYNRKYKNGCTVIFPPLSAKARDNESYHSYLTSS